ncbi:MAG: RES family NAD+ phosphorylase [Lachnospiraceae bacterium]|nr:RES family NAD+ phosphorylase [Lachnospiraceae bacterium]
MSQITDIQRKVYQDYILVGESYDVTHAIGRYAYSNGYNGIIAPSARADGGANIILFNTKGVK